ncbi:MAG: glycosyltransferase family 4 protein [Peredibacter sp.]
MHLQIFVHEFEYGVGHSKAMIEVLKRIPEEKIQKLEVVCYQSDGPHEHFSHLGDKIKIHKVPGIGIKPFLLKFIFFQLYTFFFWGLKKDKSIKISMGVCTLIADIVNIQFCHFLWAKTYFKVAQLSPHKWLYKKLLFSYIIACEDYYYSQEKLHFAFLSRFMEEEFTKRYAIEEERKMMAYSSADFSRFTVKKQSRTDLLKSLFEDYPEISHLDPMKPISLFAGAFERKGLPFLLPNIPKDHQLIVIGRGEAGAEFPLLKEKNFANVTFTKEIERFYQACDLFLFPTLFEPFGLVIMEAAMCGMRILVSKRHVGATELLEGSEGIDTIDPKDPHHQWIDSPQILQSEERLKFSTQRKESLSQLSWEKCSLEWQKLFDLLVNQNRA